MGLWPEWSSSRQAAAWTPGRDTLDSTVFSTTIPRCTAQRHTHGRSVFFYFMCNSDSSEWISFNLIHLFSTLWTSCVCVTSLWKVCEHCSSVLPPVPWFRSMWQMRHTLSASLCRTQTETEFDYHAACCGMWACVACAGQSRVIKEFRHGRVISLWFSLCKQSHSPKQKLLLPWGVDYS